MYTVAPKKLSCPVEVRAALRAGTTVACEMLVYPSMTDTIVHPPLPDEKAERADIVVLDGFNGLNYTGRFHGETVGCFFSQSLIDDASFADNFCALDLRQS